jgi:hypothetical protein
MAVGIAGGMYTWWGWAQESGGKTQNATSARVRFKEKRAWGNREVMLKGSVEKNHKTAARAWR